MAMQEEILKSLGLSHLIIHSAKQNDLPCDLIVAKNQNEVTIQYKKTNHFFRAIGWLKRNENLATFKIEEQSSFKNLAYLVDVARDAVPTIETLKRFSLKLALLGYSQLYLYLEDVISIKDEPYFGYLRGRYSKEEIRELDRYCSSLGIELIPAIQTLAHLNCIFKWPVYQQINDIGDILLVDDDRTNKLLENMFASLSEMFTSKIVHIGMDEAHLVGRGKYLDHHNFQKQYEIIGKQLSKVQQIAARHHFHLQMWSDMFFRMAFHGQYYSKKGKIPQSIIDVVPDNVDQFYWDYVTSDKQMLDNMFQNHLLLKGETCFAAGAWKWNGLNPSNRFSIQTLNTQLKKCKDYHVDNVLLTGWADDGGEASLFSTFPTILYFAECAYGENLSVQSLDKVSTSLFGVRFKEFLTCDLIMVDKGEEICGYSRFNYSNLPKILLYNDPLSGPYDGIIKDHFKLDCLPALSRKIRRIANKQSDYSYYFQTLADLTSVLEFKAKLGLRLRKAYQSRDKETLKNIADRDINKLIRRLDRFYHSFYQQWHIENKSSGFGAHSLRIGGLRQRLLNIQFLIHDYLEGRKPIIEELEEDLLPMKDEDALGFVLWTTWKNMADNGVR